MGGRIYFLGANMRRSQNHSLINSLPALERRALLAGNVTAAFNGANLVITGDNANNQVEVLYNGVDVLVRGLSGTTVNGAAADFLAVAASDTLPGNLEVTLGKGNDLLYVDDAVVVTDDLIVAPGAGNDTTVLDTVTVGGDIELGSIFPTTDDPGNDAVSMDNVTADFILVVTGTGHDLVSLDVTTTDDVVVITGSGDDLIGGDIQSAELIVLSTGSGNDLILGALDGAGVAVDMEAGNDGLVLNDLIQTDAARQATINLGKGNDRATIGLGTVNVTSLLQLHGSKGTDKLFLVPGGTYGGGLLYQEVESTAPYLVLEDPALPSLFGGSFARADKFSELLASLP
jgi:hypothetical protein